MGVAEKDASVRLNIHFLRARCPVRIVEPLVLSCGGGLATVSVGVLC